MRKNLNKEEGFLAAANFSLSAGLKELASCTLDAKEILKEAENLNRKIGDDEVETLEALEEACENFSMTWSQYKDEILEDRFNYIDEDDD